MRPPRRRDGGSRRCARRALPFTSPRLRGEVAPKARVRGSLHELGARRESLTPTLSPQAGRGSAVCSRHSAPIPIRFSNSQSVVIARSDSDEAIHRSACGAMDCFAPLAMTENTTTSRHSLAFPRRDFARGVPKQVSLKSKRAQGMPDAQPHPWPACNKKSRRQSPQVQPGQPAFPARWCYGLYVISLECRA